MDNLVYLKVNLEARSPNMDFSPLCGYGLSELVVSGGNWTKFAKAVNCLQALKRATFDSVFSYIRNNVSTPIDSSSLKYLAVTILEGTSDTLTVNGDWLEELILQLPSNVSINAPHLKMLRLMSNNLPSSFTSLVNLETFYWSSASETALLVPNMSFAPNLSSFGLQSMSIANSDVNEIWNSLPATIKSISIGPLATQSGQIVFPSTWTSLVSASIFSTRPGTFDYSSIMALHSIEELIYQGDGITSMDQLYSFPNLTKLTLLIFASRTGSIEIPPDFFVRLNKMKELAILGADFLAGTIPWYGLENLESLYLMGRFSSWPSIQGSASQLHTLFISSSMLYMIPTDTAFREANLQKLRKLSIYAPNLKSAPFFWTNSSSLSELLLSTKSYVGPLPSLIKAPRLKILGLSQNSFCGSLPDFAVPTHINSLSTSLNQLSGTIPQSWEENLSVLQQLDLSFNFLSGSIPPSLLNHHASFIEEIILENNDFTGPIWNMSSGTPLSLRFGFTGLEACAQNPSSKEGPSSTICSIDAVPRCPDRCPTFWEMCTGTTTCTEQAYTPRVPPACQVPDDTCPLPQPGVGFECNHGTWIFLGDTSGGSISLPPSVGPIVIFGNLSTNGSITFSGTGTSIEVQGCVLESPTQIVLELPEGTTPDSTTLITQRGKNCATDLSKVPVVLVSSDEGCKKRKVSTASTPTSLTVLFTIDDQCPRSSSSKRKWIILGSALGGLLVLLTAATAVLHMKSPGFRTFFRTCDVKKALAAK